MDCHVKFLFVLSFFLQSSYLISLGTANLGIDGSLENDFEQLTLSDQPGILIPHRTALDRIIGADDDEKNAYLAETALVVSVGKWIIYEHKNMQNAKISEDPQMKPSKYSKDDITRTARLIVEALLDKKGEKKRLKSECLLSYTHFTQELEQNINELEILQREVSLHNDYLKREEMTINTLKDRGEVASKAVNERSFIRPRTSLDKVEQLNLEQILERRRLAAQSQELTKQRIAFSQQQIEDKKVLLQAIGNELKKVKEYDDSLNQCIADIDKTLSDLGKHVAGVSAPEILLKSCADLKDLTSRYNITTEPHFTEQASKTSGYLCSVQ